MTTGDRPTTRPAVLVIGAGMYVGGRGTTTLGTVLPTLVQAQSRGDIGEIRVAATTSASIAELQARLGQINDRMGTQATFVGYPAQGVDPDPLAYRQALRSLSRPACAIIVVPDHLHASVTSDVIREGVHPLVVKPLTPTLDEALDLVQLAEEHGVYGAVEFHKRWDESNLLLRQNLADGSLGDLCHITVEYSQRRVVREIFRAWVDRTSIFQYLGVHYCDLIYYLTAARPIRALATGQRPTSEPAEVGRFDAIQALVEWELPGDGRRFASTIVTSWTDPDGTSALSDQKITAVGTKGRYQADQKNRGVQLVTDGHQSTEEINPYFSQLYRGADGEIEIHGYGPRSILQFIDDVRSLTAGERTRQDLIKQRPSFQDALVSTAIVDAVHSSLINDSAWVAIDDRLPSREAAAPPAKENA